MSNLILNSKWRPGPDGEPEYFTLDGPVYDDLSISGYRTCSLTMDDPNTEASTVYEPAIDVRGRHAVTWGYLIRAAEAEGIALAADFYDEENRLIAAPRRHLGWKIRTGFHRHVNRFRVPPQAATVRLSLRFSGKVSACVFLAPAAYYS